MKDVKRILYKVVGNEPSPIQITIRLPWDNRRIVLNFDLEIMSAKYDDFFNNKKNQSDYFLTLDMKVTNKIIDGSVDDEEFEFRFQNLTMIENLKEKVYDKYKIHEIFGVDEDNFELAFEL